jgi:hypothetical protein
MSDRERARFALFRRKHSQMIALAALQGWARHLVPDQGRIHPRRPTSSSNFCSVKRQNVINYITILRVYLYIYIHLAVSSLAGSELACTHHTRGTSWLGVRRGKKSEIYETGCTLELARELYRGQRPGSLDARLRVRKILVWTYIYIYWRKQLYIVMKCVSHGWEHFNESLLDWLVIYIYI